MNVKLEGYVNGEHVDLTLKFDDATLYYIARILGNSSYNAGWIIGEMKKLE